MLPQGFTRVEWIESTGEQYIDTGVKPNQDTRVVMDFQFASEYDKLSANDVFGTRSGTSSKTYAIQWNTSNNYFQHFYYNGYDNLNFGDFEKRQIAELNRNMMYLDGVAHERTYAAFQCDYPLYLSALNQAGTTNYYAAIRIYSCKIYDNDSLSRDYIPCINENGDANLWDDVNEALSDKHGTFLYGSPIVPGALDNLNRINAQNGIAFSWAPSENANEYVIARDGVRIASVYGDVTSYTDVGAIGEYTYTVTPYNGIQAGEGASITIRTDLGIPTNLNATLDDHTVTLTWDPVNGAEGYKVYRDGSAIASVFETFYIDTLTPPASAAYSVSAYVGGIISAPSQTVVVNNWAGVLPAMITDRTAADVAEAKRLRDKLITGEALTDEESARYFVGLRGAYNASDMNRVGAAVRYVADRLNAEGYGAYVDPKTDRQMEDIVRQSDWNKYLDEVRHLRRKLTLMRTTPQITDGMYSGLESYAEANAIEQILVDLDIAITCIIRNYIFSGEVFAGEV